MSMVTAGKTFHKTAHAYTHNVDIHVHERKNTFTNEQENNKYTVTIFFVLC